MKRFFWIPFCLLLALFGAALLNAAVADGLVTDWCAELDKLQDTAQAENWDSVRDDLSALHESWDAHATYFHIILQHDELIEELRSQGVTDLTSVKYAVLETDGQLSVLLYPDEQPATPKQLGKPVKDDTFLPHIFINDGRVMGENLSLAGLDAAWLDKTVRAQGYHAPSEIFLLSLDGAGKILCIGKDSAK